MIIPVKVKTKSSESSVIFSNGIYTLLVKNPSYKTKANVELIDTLSSYFNTSKSSVKILEGVKGNEKLVEIVEYEIKKEG